MIKSSVRIARVPTKKILKEHLPNTSLECYHYTILLGGYYSC
jgi:hypothetical protein